MILFFYLLEINIIPHMKFNFELIFNYFSSIKFIPKILKIFSLYEKCIWIDTFASLYCKKWYFYFLKVNYYVINDGENAVLSATATGYFISILAPLSFIQFSEICGEKLTNFHQNCIILVKNRLYSGTWVQVITCPLTSGKTFKFIHHLIICKWCV